MSKINSLIICFLLNTCLLSSSFAESKDPDKSTKKKIATSVGRAVIGPAVGGTAGKIITGGPVGAGLGILLSPTRIACGKGETCADQGK